MQKRSHGLYPPIRMLEKRKLDETWIINHEYKPTNTWKQNEGTEIQQNVLQIYLLLETLKPVMLQLKSYLFCSID